MKLHIVFALILLIFLVLALVFIIINKPFFTGQSVKDNQNTQYTYTKAICNSSNYCQDYEITCNNGSPISLSPITGAAIQKPENWQDSRENNLSLC